MSKQKAMTVLDPDQKKPGTSIDMGVLENGTIVIQFGNRVKEIQFTPAQAKGFGLGLIEMGTRGESLQRVSPPGKTATGPRRVQ